MRANINLLQNEKNIFMSEIYSIANIDWFKYVFGIIALLFGLINSLLIYIFNQVKKDIIEIKRKTDADHEILSNILTEHKIFHRCKKSE